MRSSKTHQFKSLVESNKEAMCCENGHSQRIANFF